MKAKWALRVLKRRGIARAMSALSVGELDSELSYVEREWRKPPPGDISLNELTEKVMQFGYVVVSFLKRQRLNSMTERWSTFFEIPR